MAPDYAKFSTYVGVATLVGVVFLMIWPDFQLNWRMWVNNTTFLISLSLEIVFNFEFYQKRIMRARWPIQKRKHLLAGTT